MKIHETVTEPRKVLKGFSCDMCGIDMPLDEDGRMVTVTFNSKWTDGYDNYGETNEMQLCKPCTSKAFIALHSVGLDIYLYDVD